MGSGRESFQILLNRNWLSAVHPNSPHISYLDEGHKLQGPDEDGAQSHWSIGSHEDDKLRQGDRVRIKMRMAAGLPVSVSWTPASPGGEEEGAEDDIGIG